MVRLGGRPPACYAMPCFSGTPSSMDHGMVRFGFGVWRVLLFASCMVFFWGSFNVVDCTISLGSKHAFDPLEAAKRGEPRVGLGDSARPTRACACACACGRLNLANTQYRSLQVFSVPVQRCYQTALLDALLLCF